MTPDPRVTRVHRIIVSQAVTGESVGIEHYARMIGIANGTDERLALLEDAYRERAHLLAMREVARKLAIPVDEAPNDAYWTRVRAAFDEAAVERDLARCSLVQDVILESYAIVLYDSLLPGVDELVAAPIRRIAADERGHLADGVAQLRSRYAADPTRTERDVEWANERVARVLAEWVKSDDCQPVCGVCGAVGGGCAKEDLRAQGIDTDGFQPAFADLYGRSLREAGLPAANVARWLARLIQ